MPGQASAEAGRQNTTVNSVTVDAPSNVQQPICTVPRADGNAQRLDGISPVPQNFVGESVAISNHLLAMYGGPLASAGGRLPMRGGSMAARRRSFAVQRRSTAFLRSFKTILGSPLPSPTARWQWAEGLWPCTEGRSHFSEAR